MAHPAEAHAAEAHAHAPQSFIWRYVFSKDHKVIGIQYYVTAMLMALVAGILAMLVRMQLAWPDSTFPGIGRFLPSGFSDGVMNPEFYAMLFTMHGTIMVFFVLSTAPVSGFGNLLIPLQTGARDMAFPFLNGLSYWTFLPGCITILAVLLRERRGRRRRLDRLSPALGPPERHPGLAVGTDPLDRGHGLLHRLLHHGRPQLRDHHPEPAHQGPVHDAHAHDPLVDVPRGHPGPARLPGPHRRLADAPLRPPLRDELLPAQRPRGLGGAPPRGRRVAAPPGRIAPALAAPLLVPRPPRGLHPDAARPRASPPTSSRSSPARPSSATRRWWGR